MIRYIPNSTVAAVTAQSFWLRPSSFLVVPGVVLPPVSLFANLTLTLVVA